MNSLVTLRNVVFTANQAIGFGGAIDALSCNLVAENCTFTRNSAATEGGAIRHTAGVTTLRSCRFVMNQSALVGSGLFTLTRCALTANQAGSYGGAILAIVQGGLVPMTSLALTDCDVSANESGDLGGGICTQGGTRLSITGSAISGNSATVAADVRLLNATVSENFAGQGAAVLASSGSVVKMSFVTLNENVVPFSPNSAAVENGNNSSIYVTNSIVANTHNGAGIPRRNCAGQVFDLGGNYSNDDTCPCFTKVTAARLALGPLQPNPPGRTPTNALGRNSAAVDGARNCQDAASEPVGVDQRGVRRPQGPQCDAGAYDRRPTGRKA